MQRKRCNSNTGMWVWRGSAVGARSRISMYLGSISAAYIYAVCISAASPLYLCCRATLYLGCICAAPRPHLCCIATLIEQQRRGADGAPAPSPT